MCERALRGNEQDAQAERDKFKSFHEAAHLISFPNAPERSGGIEFEEALHLRKVIKPRPPA